MKKRILVVEIIAILILILSFIIPIRKEEKWIVVEDTNPTGFFGGGFTTSEKYEIYYNIYNNDKLQFID